MLVSAAAEHHFAVRTLSCICSWLLNLKKERSVVLNRDVLPEGIGCCYNNGRHGCCG